MRRKIVVLLLIGAAVWSSGLDGVFLYDDFDSITLNPHMRTLWPLSEAMSRPLADAAETVSTRPVLSLTFALDYAVHGLDPTGYHVVNIAIHLAAAVLLFAFLRTTLALPRVPPAVRARADVLAFASSLLWLVHPLHTSAVTYVVQRAESLGGVLLLLVLYPAARGATAERPRQWWLVAVAACWLGAATKETIAAAPLLVLVHHATFVDGSYRAALAKRWPLYAALALSWGLLWLLLSSDTGELVGAGRGLSYALTQPSAILRYVRLALWPHPLALSYDWPVYRSLSEIMAPGLVVGAALAATAVGVARKRWWGFAGACFFAILAPSSSVFGLTQKIMEHRMYLPLAALITPLVIGADALVRRSFAAGARVTTPRWAVAPLAAVTCALALATVVRNRDYADEIGFWRGNVSAQPSDSIAQLQLGRAYLRSGALEEARGSFEAAARLGPPFAPVYNELGRTLLALGDLDRAQLELRRALDLDPSLAVAHNNVGLVAERRGNGAGAATSYRRALELDPSLEVARENLARVAGGSPAGAEMSAAEATGERAAATSLLTAGAALERDGRLDEAQASYEKAVALDADNLAALNALATVLARRGRDEDAIRRFESVLAIDARNLDALRNLGALHAMRGRDREALRYLEAAAAADRNATRVHFNLGLLYEKQGDLQRAGESFTREVALDPGFAQAHAALARVLEHRGDRAAAAEHYAKALELAPGLDDAREGLRRVRPDSNHAS